MVQFLESAFAAFTGVGQRACNETVRVEAVDGSSGGVGDVLAVSGFEVVGVLARRYAEVCGAGATVRAKERFPVVRYAEDQVCICEGWDEGGDFVYVGVYDLDALGCKILCNGGARLRVRPRM